MMRSASLSVVSSALLLLGATVTAASPVDVGSPMHCSTYTVGADTHTECSPGPSAPPAAAFACYDYTVGTDPHAECSPVPRTRLAPLRGKIAAPPPIAAPRCSTYHIGSSTYTECR
jgi:hypothetical protein